MESNLKKYSRYVGILSSVVLLGCIIYYFSNIVTWLVLAWVVSLVGSPIMHLLGRIRIKSWQLPSSIRALMVLLLFYLGFGVFISVFAPVIVQQGRNLAGVDYAAIMQALEEPIAHISDWMIEKGLSDGELSEFAYQNSTLHHRHNFQQDTLQENLVGTTTIQIDSIIRAKGDTITKTNIQLDLRLLVEDAKGQAAHLHDSTTIVHHTDPPFEQLRKRAFQYISPAQIITQSVFYAASLFGNFLVLLTSVTFIAFFFLKDEKLFGNGINILIPNKYFDKTEQALKNIKRLLTRYFSGILLQITIITLFLTTTLSLCGVPNSFLIAFFAAIINVIPYIGPLIGGLFAVLVTISSNLDVDFYTITLPMIYKVMGIFFTMQMLDGFVLQPYIFSNSVSAHPLEIFLIVVIGAQLGGALGMVIAIPMYTIIRVIAATFLQEFEIVQKITENISEDVSPEEEEGTEEQANLV